MTLLILEVADRCDPPVRSWDVGVRNGNPEAP